MLRDWSELIGNRLGNYTIQSLIRETHMSAVYYGTEFLTECPVAVKVLFPNIGFGGREYNKSLMRFQREAYFIANLRHVYIVPILAYSDYEELAYLVMPYYANGTLGTLLRQRGRLSLHETARYIEQIAPALDHAHARNIIHRDIKPGNFLLDDNNRLILTDFGIARLAGNPNWATLTTTNKVLGTPEYMAPEMLRGRKADLRADIYALGIVIFEMLCGEVPFAGNDMYEIMDQHFNTPLPSLHALHPEIPSTVDSVLRKATAKNREDRFASVNELAVALSRATAFHGLNNAPTEVDLSPVLTLSSQVLTFPPTFQAGQVAIHSAHNQIARPSLKFIARALSGILLTLLFLVFGLAYGPTLFSSIQSLTTPAPIPMLTPTQHGRTAVQEYFDDWNNGQFQLAYTILNPEFQKKFYPYQRSNYARVQYSCISIDQVTLLSSTEVQVDITINQIEDTRSSNGAAINAYTGYFLVQQIGGTWYIWPYISLTSTHGSCSKP